MIHRSARFRSLFFGTLIAIVPILDVVAGGTAGLMHFFATMAGIALLAAALTPGGRPRLGYERYDPS
jgi:hypothetical protein